jgi:hypothetical protein
MEAYWGSGGIAPRILYLSFQKQQFVPTVAVFSAQKIRVVASSVIDLVAPVDSHDSRSDLRAGNLAFED